MVCRSALFGALSAVPCCLALAAVGAGAKIKSTHDKHRLEREKERLGNGAGSVEESVVTVENKGPVGGTAGVAEVVTAGPLGTTVSTVPTGAGGVATVSTDQAGIPGGTVTTEPGHTTIVKAEHTRGTPGEAVITETESVPSDSQDAQLARALTTRPERSHH